MFKAEKAGSTKTKVVKGLDCFWNWQKASVSRTQTKWGDSYSGRANLRAV